ncbi:MAG: choice-of-anchor J domain-containing protein, partial [Bacteroidales bacterium]|nr:choice-of-anchor J domain-containing protein [Bacteroidales bacterium]
EDNILYEDDITSYEVGGANYYIPTLTGFDFQGWYLDSACQTAATATSLSKMPMDGVVLYAKWQQRAIRVALYVNGGTLPQGQDWQFKIAEYEVISSGQEIKPTRSGYEFVGWYEDPNFTKPYNFNTALFYKENDSTSTADTYSAADRDTFGDSARPFVVGIRKLYAKWRKDLPGANGLTVVYKADDTDDPSTGTGTFPSGYDPGDNKTSTDRKPYQDGTEAIGRAASEPESGKRFLYWEYKKANGETVKVYPGKPFTLDAADAEHVGPNSTPNQPQTSVMPASTPVRSASGGTRPMTAEEPTTVISWDFESGNLNDWTQIDNDGDGNVWYTYNDSTISHGGSYCIYSESYRYNSSGSGGTVLYPDNWLISSGVLLPETGTNQISIWARGLGSTYYNEKFEVYVTTNKTSVANIKSNGTKVISETATGAYKEYTATIPDSYAGKTVYVVIRHGDVYDQYALLVDDVTVTNTPADAAGEGDEVIWVPVDTIDTTKDYLIGYIDDNGDTWLIMNYNPDASSSYYNFYVDDGQKTQKGAYAIKAIKNSEGKVTGLVSDTIVNATFDNVEWNFAEQTGGKYKIYHNNSYLRIDNSATTYTPFLSSNTYYSENALSFYPGSDNDTFAVWTWNNKLTCAASNSITKAVIVLKNSSNVISGFC